MISRFICCLLLLLVSETTVAQLQDAQQAKYFTMGISVPIVKVRDLGHSPLIYKGVGTTFIMRVEQMTDKTVSRFSINATMGSAKPKKTKKSQTLLSKMSFSVIEFNYAHYQRSDYFDNDWKGYLGGNTSLTLDLRNYELPSNNLFGYHINFALNASSFFIKPLERQRRFEYEAMMPLVSWGYRPNYIGMVPFTGSSLNAKKFLRTGVLTTVNKNFRFYNAFGILEQTKDYRQNRLYYSWDFKHNRQSQKLTSVQGGLGYETNFRM